MTTNVAILGASGYTGAELVRLLLNHEGVRIKALSAEQQAGQSMAAVYPQFAPYTLPPLVKLEALDSAQIDFLFCALPHGTTQSIIAQLPEHVRVVDLSADFRFFDCDTYASVYGLAHKAPDLQKKVVYGLTEHAGEAVAKARLVANPGCYPTAVQLALIPLLQEGLIEAQSLVIDAKSGATGAGRGAKRELLFCEINDGFHAYAPGSHRHAPEIDQGLEIFAGVRTKVSFTPHLLPMNRGILATLYFESRAHLKTLRLCLEKAYSHKPFVHLLPEGILPRTQSVRGTNHCFLNIFPDRVSGRFILVCVIDNLGKGAAGQAVQNMNLMLGFEETKALEHAALTP